MAWIEAHQGLAQHPKTKRMARMLGISTAEAIGHLFMLWWWGMDYAQDGDLSKYDELDIADAAQWTGDAKAFIDALKNCGPGDSSGFIDEHDGRVSLHDWDAYAGRLFNIREQNRERQARHKEQKKIEAAREQRDSDADITDGSRVSNASVTREQRDDNAQVTRYKSVSNAPVTRIHNITNITEQNKTEQDLQDLPPPTPPAGGSPPEGDSQASSGGPESPPSSVGGEAGNGQGCTLSQVIRLWNEELGPLGFPKVAKGTPARDRCFSARVGEQAERRDLEWWRERIAQLAASDFMRSSARDKANWLNFDWLLNESNLVKVVEGRYANGKSLPARSGGARSSPPSARDAPMTYEEAVAKFRGSSTAVDVEYIDVEEG